MLKFQKVNVVSGRTGGIGEQNRETPECPVEKLITLPLI